MKVGLRTPAMLEALLVTFLWSSSYILIKIGLQDVSPLTFSAMRYSLAFAVLLLLSSASRQREARPALSSQEWVMLIAAGACGYAVAQGLQFVGLYYLPAVTVSFLLNFTPIFALVLGATFLDEKPTGIQLVGIIVALVGAYAYFLTSVLLNKFLAVSIVLVSGLGWAAYMIIVRDLQRVGKIGTFHLTTASMGVGAAILLASALAGEGLPSITLQGWGVIIWLSLVNTALAFYLWNHALKGIRAYELSVLQNTMLVQIAILASIFLGEELTVNKVFGIVLVLFGITLVQIRRRQQDRTIDR